MLKHLSWLLRTSGGGVGSDWWVAGCLVDGEKDPSFPEVLLLGYLFRENDIVRTVLILSIFFRWLKQLWQNHFPFI